MQYSGNIGPTAHKNAVAASPFHLSPLSVPEQKPREIDEPVEGYRGFQVCFICRMAMGSPNRREVAARRKRAGWGEMGKRSGRLLRLWGTTASITTAAEAAFRLLQQPKRRRRFDGLCG